MESESQLLFGMRKQHVGRAERSQHSRTGAPTTVATRLSSATQTAGCFPVTAGERARSAADHVLSVLGDLGDGAPHYRTTPLGGLFTRMKGGFYHDGRFADLNAVVSHYAQLLKFTLSDQERRDLIEYLKSL